MAKKKFKAHQGAKQQTKSNEELFNEAKEVMLIKVKALDESLDTSGIIFRLAGAMQDFNSLFDVKEKVKLSDIFSYRDKIHKRIKDTEKIISELKFENIKKEKLPKELCFDVNKDHKSEDIILNYMCENILSQMVDRFYQLKSYSMNEQE